MWALTGKKRLKADVVPVTLAAEKTWMGQTTQNQVCEVHGAVLFVCFLLAMSRVGCLTVELRLVFMAAEDPMVRHYRIFFPGTQRVDMA